MEEKLAELEKKFEEKQLAIDNLVKFNTDFKNLQAQSHVNENKINTLMQTLAETEASINSLKTFAAITQDYQDYQAQSNKKIEQLFQELSIASKPLKSLIAAVAEATEIDEKLQIRLTKESVENLNLIKFATDSYVVNAKQTLEARGAILNLDILLIKLNADKKFTTQELETLEGAVKQLLDDYVYNRLPASVRLKMKTLTSENNSYQSITKTDKDQLIREMKKTLINSYFNYVAIKNTEQLDKLFQDTLEVFKEADNEIIQPYLAKTNSELVQIFKQRSDQSENFTQLVQAIKHHFISASFKKIRLLPTQQQEIDNIIQQAAENTTEVIVSYWHELLAKAKRKLDNPLQVEVTLLQQELKDLQASLSEAIEAKNSKPSNQQKKELNTNYTAQNSNNVKSSAQSNTRNTNTNATQKMSNSSSLFYPSQASREAPDGRVADSLNFITKRPG